MSLFSEDTYQASLIKNTVNTEAAANNYQRIYSHV